jgi:hypothetical protein
MSDQRTVNLHINATQQTQIVENLEACLRRQMEESETTHAQFKRLGRINPRNEYYAALGYLSTWNMTHAVVNIYPESQGADNTDFIAVYKRADGTLAYTIAAIWHDDHYGFHS